MKLRLIIANFLEFAVWGAYLTSMGRYLGSHGFGASIGWFYSVQGIVSLLMPALMGIVADRWIPAEKTLSLCHAIAGAAMCAAGAYAFSAGDAVSFAPLFSLYTLSVAFFMPTIALTNSVAFNALMKAGLDTVKDFPPIRVFGTVGFILTMWVVDFLGFKDGIIGLSSISIPEITIFGKHIIGYTGTMLSFQATPAQFLVSGGLSIVLALYALTLPKCEIKEAQGKQSLVDALGLRAFALFKQKKMALFFIFSMMLGMCLQVTNGYANPFLGFFEHFTNWADTFGVKHSNILISISQICEALCILFIPYFLKKFGIKNVMFMAMIAWVLRFGLFGLGNPGMPGVLLFVLSCVVYGFAFDFFNISGALFVDREVPEAQRSSAQGLFMMMTNGVGATIGTLSAQAIVNNLVPTIPDAKSDEWLALISEAPEKALEMAQTTWHGWQTAWYIFAGFALVVAILFWIFFPKTTKE